jgi:hypothetical protein
MTTTISDGNSGLLDLWLTDCPRYKAGTALPPPALSRLPRRPDWLRLTAA